MPELPKVCPVCGTSNIACVRVPGTGWVCTCSDCGNDWTVVESLFGVSAVMLGLWLILFLSFFVSVATLKKGGI